ncbi:MAG: TIGR01777 family oxidoreductase [Isosphaeraceae bacterium]
MTGAGACIGIASLTWPCRLTLSDSLTLGRGAMFMRVFITGGSGLIGRHLARGLLEAGHQPVILSRHSDVVRRKSEFRHYQVVQGDPTTEGRWQDEIDGCDAVVNLAGHNLFAERWNTEIKRKIRDSRVHGTDHVVAAISRARKKPGVLVQASAIGYYGPHGDEELDETSPSGADFLAVVCREWEQTAEPVTQQGVRLAVVRIGIVLAPGEGALAFMTPIFKLGPGAPIGSGGSFLAKGQQWMSWVHIDDIAGIFQMAVEKAEATGPINGTAPNPVRNAEFSKTLSSVLRKPYTPWRFFLPVGPPDFVIQLMLGEVAGVVTTGQKVLPTRARVLGYHYRFPDLVAALRDVYTPKPVPSPPSQKPVAAGAGSHH